MDKTAVLTNVSAKATSKKIDESIDKPLYDQMHQRLQTRKAKIYKKLRSSTVEPVLGTLINFMGMRRIWTRGIEQANKFMLGAAIGYNLKKWLHYKPKKRKVEEMLAPVIQSGEKCLKKLLFFIFAPPQRPYLITV